VCECMYVYVRVCMYVNVCAYMHHAMHLCVFVCVRTHIHTYFVR